MNILSPWTFFLHSGIFRHMDFSAWGHFGTGTCWHGTLRCGFITTLGYFGTLHSNMDVSAQGHFDTVRKCTYVEMSQCCNIPMPECLWRHNVHLPECLPSCKVPVPKKPVMKCPCWNVSCQNVKCRKKPNPIIMYETHKSHWNRKPLL